MQKKIIALAVAGLMSGAAFAQSNVTVYGVADTFFGNDKGSAAAGTNNDRTVVDSGALAGSRIGFRGTEDLGNGMRALFTLEYSIATDTGTGLTQARQSFVGITGNFGTVVGGRLYSPGYNQASKFNTGTGGQRFSALAALQDGAGATINMGNAGRLNNALAYVSPNFNGLTATVAYTANTETANTTQSDRIWGLGLDYDNGPMSVGFSHHNIATPIAAVNAATSLTTVSSATGACATGGTIVGTVSQAAGVTNITNICSSTSAATAAGTSKQKENALFGSYDFGVVKAVLSYQTLKSTNSVTNTTTGDNRIWNIGGIVPFGPGNFTINYASLNDKRINDADAKAWAMGYTYNMSKRTRIYGGWSQVKNSNAAAVGVAGGLAPTAGTSDKSRSYGVGLNHSF